MKRSSVIALGVTAVLAIGPSTAHAADYSQRASHLLEKGDVRGARIELQNAVRQNPKDGAAQYALGRLELELGNPAAAAEQARYAKEDGYDVVKSLSLLLETYFARGQLGQLLKDFPADKGAPDTAALIGVARGRAEMALGEPEKATAEFAHARKLAPHSPAPLLGEADLAISHNDLAGAKRDIEAALRLAPQSTEVLLQQTRILLMTGKAQDALSVVQRVLARSPSNISARLLDVQALLATGKVAPARTELEGVLKILPGSAEGLYLAALMRAQTHDYKGAAKILQKLSPIMGRLPHAYFLQAEVMANLGQLAQAQVAAQKYAGHFPNDPRGVRLLADLNIRTGDVQAAISALDGLSPAERAKPATIELLGLAHSEIGDLQTASKDFEKATKLAPKAALPFAELGEVQVGLGNPVEAIAELQKALALKPKDAAIRRRLILVAIRSGRYALARSNLDDLKKQVGETAPDANLTGVLQSAEGDLAGARVTFTALVKKYPKFLPGIFNLARVNRANGEIDKADDLLKGVLAQQPANASALKALIPALLAEKKTAEAVQFLTRAHEVAPQNVPILVDLILFENRVREPKKTLALLEQSTELTARYPAIFLMIKAQAEVEAGNVGAAEKTLRSLLQVAPSDVGARLTLSSMLIQEKNFAAAQAAVEDGLHATPHSYALMQALIGVQYAKGGLSAALREAKRLEADPHYAPESHSLSGDLYAVRKNWQEAAASYAAALKSDPSSLPLTLRYAAALQHVGEQDRAVLELKGYLARHPKNVPVTLMLSNFDLSAGQLDQAAKKLSAVIAADPNNVAALNNLAWIDQRKNRPEAQSLAERAYFLSPNGHTADTLGWILARSGSHAAGLALLRAAHSALSDSPTITYHLAYALSETGDPKAAEALLRPIVTGKRVFADKTAAQALLTKVSTNQ